MINKCPFCNLDKDRVIFENIHSYAILDIYPVTKGHTLIIPKRHIFKLEDLNDEEVTDIFETFKKVKNGIENFLNAMGFNFGLNLGEVSGQSIEHIHFHLIPRYKEDKNFPDGGIRKVAMKLTEFNLKDLKSKWIENRLNDEEIKKLKELIVNL